MIQPVRLALVGLGKIARDHHLPAIAGTTGVNLVAVASRNASLDGVTCFRTLDDLLSSSVAFDAVTLCTPAQGRRSQVEQILAAGKHVMLGKPPVAALTEMAPMLERASQAGRVLFATWHSRFGVTVEPARDYLARSRIRSVAIEWKEDVRFWHPRQDWIWEPGGFGVFDPGINALSIATRILPRPFFLTEADLFVPANRAMPIAASLAFADTSGVPITADFDFRHREPRIWSIQIQTDDGRFTLSDGGARLTRDDAVIVEETPIVHDGLSPNEYRGLYRQFVSLVGSLTSDADILPLMHASDAFALGRRHTVEPFEDR